MQEQQNKSRTESIPKISDSLPDPCPFNNSQHYLNRELGWLQFNHRVLLQAADLRVPLLERVKFLAIAGSNLDEFFMKRIGGLKQQSLAGVQKRTIDGRSPDEQIAECYEVIKDHQKHKQKILIDLTRELAQENIFICTYTDLTETEKNALRSNFYDNIYPMVTPQAIDPAHPFPFVSNLSLNLLVNLRYPGSGELSLARVKVPVGRGAPRFLPIDDQNRFVLLEDVMANNLDMLFPAMEVVSCDLFRVTRNANTDKSEEHADDLLALIESALRERKFAPIVRLEILPDMNESHRGLLAAELGLDQEADVFEVNGIIGARDFMQLTALPLPQLKDIPHLPIDHPQLTKGRNIFYDIREARFILLQHPYESFASSVGRFLKEAATDPKVQAIKMTLYRTSSDSPILDQLIQAAQNGKQVAVVVELQARFDEAANIRLATRLEEAGIHVTYGVVGLKTHAKVILVVRRDYKGLRRYVHIGTGNYHPETSRLYSDLGMLIYDKQIGQDATELFNYLTTGYTPARRYQQLLVAPKSLKKALLAKIEREIEHQQQEREGHLRFKMNALEDGDIAKALYRAAQAGVRVELLIRDSCRVRPNLPGLTETVRVVSIVGRFLEHTRLYYFRNAGQEEYFIGSADAMKRNLEHRVEVLVPVTEPKLQQELWKMLETQWHDQRCAWDMQEDGSYIQRQPKPDEDHPGSQELTIQAAKKRKNDVMRQKERKGKKGRQRNLR
ncbi:RNA degradosome polyphosphate kinase [Syntrophotalea acetylenivorans]|uniref:Polyphosphate kinase n=1 Tax=Syntrophotalea acetylenivorans TaxID=1842532 RepID=A0A1L3GLH2_9BACT|nr:RNA degradosome polyphosphate kinase [Syntrophotalea acetylenivorans]